MSTKAGQAHAFVKKLGRENGVGHENRIHFPQLLACNTNVDTSGQPLHSTLEQPSHSYLRALARLSISINV